MKDYLLELLNNHQNYKAVINTMKTQQSMFNDPDEYERYMQIDRDLVFLNYCIEQLKPEYREVLTYLYFKGFSMKQLGIARHLSKSGIENQKKTAIRQLRTIFRVSR